MKSKLKGKNTDAKRGSRANKWANTFSSVGLRWAQVGFLANESWLIQHAK